MNDLFTITHISWIMNNIVKFYLFINEKDGMIGQISLLQKLHVLSPLKKRT